MKREHYLYYIELLSNSLNSKIIPIVDKKDNLYTHSAGYYTMSISIASNSITGSTDDLSLPELHQALSILMDLWKEPERYVELISNYDNLVK